MSIAEKLLEVAENVPKVFEAGKQAEYDSFWDKFQANGTRTNYDYVFAGNCWNAQNFKPKYDIVPESGVSMFRYWRATSFDFKAHLDSLGVILDTSKCAACGSMFQDNITVTHIGVISIVATDTITNMFYNAAIETIDELIVDEDNAYTNAFYKANNLKNITATGTIAKSFNVSYSPLTVASMKSIILCLKNYAGTSNEGTYTLKFSSACWTALEADSASPNGGSWVDYVTDLGWGI